MYTRTSFLDFYSPETIFIFFTARGYSGAKLENNLQCEIFDILLEEAKESYKKEIVVAMKSNTVDDMNSNVATITEWARSWSSTN